MSIGSDTVKLRDGHVDLVHHRVIRGGVQADLTPIEVKLIHYLLAQQGRPVSRQTLLVDVWEYAPTTRSRAVDFAVRRLRFKIEAEPAQPVHLIAVPKVGYRFEAAEGAVVTATATNSGSNQPAPAGKHLPPMANALMGRETDLAVMKERVESGAHLLTLCGPPGIGKTRLAIGFANGVEKRFPGGIWLCDLQEAQSEEGLRDVLARTFGRSEQVSLETFFANHPAFLLIMDNVEHLIEVGSQCIDAWQRMSPESVWICTSRSALNLPQEQLIPVGPLQGDGATKAGVEVFLARARQLVPHFGLDAHNTADVEAIVERLQGVPLSIELAASRIRHFSTAQILKRLSKQSGFLSAPGRGVGRHSTLDATLDWSWSLLSPCEQSALAQCAVFRGGFTFDAVDTVLDLSEWGAMGGDVVAVLVDHSLVRGPDWAAHSDEYQMLDFIRVYAAKRLYALDSDFVEKLRRRHAQFYSNVELDGWSFYRKWTRATTEGVRRLHGERENLIAASQFAQESDEPDWTLRLALKLAERHQYVGWSPEHRRWIVRAKDVETKDPIFRWNVIRHRAWGSVESSKNQRAPELFRESVVVAESASHAEAIAEARGMLAEWLTVCGEYEEADQLLAKSQQYAEDADDLLAKALAQVRLGTVAFLRGEVAKSRAQLEQGVKYFKSVDLPHYEIRFGQILAEVCRRDGDLERCEAEWSRALARCEQVSDRLHAARAHLVLGIHLMNQGRLDAAKEQLEKALELSNRIGNPKDWARACVRLAAVYTKQGDLSAAEREFERSAPILLEAVTPKDWLTPYTVEVELRLALGQVDAAKKAFGHVLELAQWLPEERLKELQEQVEAAS